MRSLVRVCPMPTRGRIRRPADRKTLSADCIYFARVFAPPAANNINEIPDRGFSLDLQPGRVAQGKWSDYPATLVYILAILFCSQSAWAGGWLDAWKIGHKQGAEC